MLAKYEFGVVIPTKNRVDDLIAAVKSVIGQTHKPDEIVIIDQSNDDKAKVSVGDLLKNEGSIKVKYIYNNTIDGLTAAKNLAIKNSDSDILLFIDDDIILQDNFLGVLQNIYYKYPELSGVGGISFLPEEKTSTIRKKVALFFQLGPFRDLRAVVQAGYLGNREIVRTWLLSGGLSSLKREVFENSAFNEELKGASPIEDMDFYSRASQNFKFALAPAAHALHNVSPVSREGLRRVFEAKCEGFIFIFSTYVKKSFLNRMAFIWRSFGMFIDAIVSSVSFKTLDPVRGIFSAWKKYLSTSGSK